jgi:chromate transport protein ChrA
MAAVTWELARAAFPDAYTLLVGGAAAVLLFRFKANSVALIALGAAAGVLSALF